MRERAIAKHCAFIFVGLALGDVRLAKAHDNYEIQVYGSDTVAPKSTMLEPHSNFTAEGSLPVPGSRFIGRLILTYRRTLIFRRQTDIGKSSVPCGIWSLMKSIDSVLLLCPGDALSTNPTGGPSYRESENGISRSAATLSSLPAPFRRHRILKVPSSPWPSPASRCCAFGR